MKMSADSNELDWNSMEVFPAGNWMFHREPFIEFPIYCDKIGLFTGSFDPPHIGHLRLAISAMEECELDCVVFFPVSSTSTKARHHENGVNRIDMFRTILSCPGYENLFVSSYFLESQYCGSELPSGLEQVCSDLRLQGASPTVICGSDVYDKIKNHSAYDKLKEYHFCVGTRGNALELESNSTSRIIDSRGASSTKVRALLQRRDSADCRGEVADLLGEQLFNWISASKFYRV